MKVIIRRFIELFFVNFILSAIVTGLYELELLAATQTAVKFAMLISAIIYVVIQVFMLRQCFFDLSNKYDYYLFNYAAYAIFMVFNIVLFFFGGSFIFTWLFGITKFLRFINHGIDTFFGILVFHLVMLIAITLAPIGMGWVFLLRKDTDGEQEEQPTLLEADDIE